MYYITGCGIFYHRRPPPPVYSFYYYFSLFLPISRNEKIHIYPSPTIFFFYSHVCIRRYNTCVYTGRTVSRSRSPTRRSSRVVVRTIYARPPIIYRASPPRSTLLLLLLLFIMSAKRSGSVVYYGILQRSG